MIIFTVLIPSMAIAFSLIVLDLYLPGEYLAIFLEQHFIATFAILIGFNFAAATFLLGQLMSIVASCKKDPFQNTKRELGHNVHYLFISFFIVLVGLIFRPPFYISSTPIKDNLFYYLDTLIILTMFISAIYCIFEILSVVFKLASADLYTKK